MAAKCKQDPCTSKKSSTAADMKRSAKEYEESLPPLYKTYRDHYLGELAGVKEVEYEQWLETARKIATRRNDDNIPTLEEFCREHENLCLKNPAEAEKWQQQVNYMLHLEWYASTPFPPDFFVTHPRNDLPPSVAESLLRQEEYGIRDAVARYEADYAQRERLRIFKGLLEFYYPEILKEILALHPRKTKPENKRDTGKVKRSKAPAMKKELEPLAINHYDASKTYEENHRAFCELAELKYLPQKPNFEAYKKWLR